MSENESRDNINVIGIYQESNGDLLSIFFIATLLQVLLTYLAWYFHQIDNIFYPFGKFAIFIGWLFYSAKICRDQNMEISIPGFGIQFLLCVGFLDAIIDMLKMLSII